MKFKIFLFLVILISACNNKKNPDVSGIAVDTRLHRFDQFLFERVDTSNMQEGIGIMQKEYAFFTNDFFVNILGVPAPHANNNDTSANTSFGELKRFIRLTRPLYDSLVRSK